MHLAIPLILFFILTIGNYSFFRYTIDGTVKNSFVSLLAQIRIVLPLWPIFYAFRLNYSFSIRILRHNLDVLAMLLCWLLSAASSLNTESYLLYSTWTTFSFIGVLLVISFTALISRSPLELISLQLSIMWMGNIVVFLLVIGSFLIRPPGSGIYAILYSSNSFWAYPMLILGIISAIRIRWTEKEKTRKLLCLFVLVICFTAIYLSARRGPLLVLSLAILMIYLPSKFPHFLVALGILVLLISQSKPETLVGNLPDSFMKYRLTRLLGLVRAQKETSYATRERIWNSYMREFYNNPTFGTGLSGRFDNENNREESGYFSPHNTFVGLLSEKGLVGAGLFVLVIGNSLVLIGRLLIPDLMRLYLILFLPTIAINWVEYNLLPGQIFFLYSVIIWLLPRGLLLVQNQDRNPI